MFISCNNISFNHFSMALFPYALNTFLSFSLRSLLFNRFFLSIVIHPMYCLPSSSSVYLFRSHLSLPFPSASSARYSFQSIHRVLSQVGLCPLNFLLVLVINSSLCVVLSLIHVFVNSKLMTSFFPLQHIKPFRTCSFIHLYFFPYRQISL